MNTIKWKNTDEDNRISSKKNRKVSTRNWLLSV